jgi:hypothetical protein
MGLYNITNSGLVKCMNNTGTSVEFWTTYTFGSAHWNSDEIGDTICCRLQSLRDRRLVNAFIHRKKKLIE